MFIRTLALFMMLTCLHSHATPEVRFITDTRANIEQLKESCETVSGLRPHPLLVKLMQRKDLGRKYTAALLAFPFPFGIVGLHRIYLGCAPYVPVVYIATLGGVFGLLPLIDCIVILLEKDMEHYANNKQVFMWIK
jgi:TM2 domain-containing membrane protein YozV